MAPCVSGGGIQTVRLPVKISWRVAARNKLLEAGDFFGSHSGCQQADI
jgi:hypothetical protein